MITDENKKKKIIPSICRFFDWQFWATIDMKLKKKKDFQVHVKYCTMIDSEMESVAMKICQ